VQICLSIATVVASGCGPVARMRTGKRLGSSPHEQPQRTSAMFQTSNTLSSMYFFCNSRTHVMTLYSGHVCAVLWVNASMLINCMDHG
jgi:hypothetical protein